ncbi:MAG: murein transglycosylase A [Flavobacteriaceae bacterium]
MLRGLLAGVLAAGMFAAGPAATHAAGYDRKPVAFSDLPGWRAADHRGALEAFRRSCGKLAGGAFASACRDAASTRDARGFFERHFSAFRVVTSGGQGFLTGYFEPEYPGSLTPGGRYGVPLLARPSDLVDIKPGALPGGLTAARKAGGGLEAYPDRAAIEDGALGAAARPVVWLADPVDAFFVHIQGSARIALAQGGSIRVGFAGRNGHAYTPVGRILIDRGEIAREEMTAGRLRDWLKAHPREARAIMRENRSYIFFRRVDAPDALGPVGAQGVPLTPMHSIAVDRAFHTLGTPVYVSGDLPLGPGGAPIRVGDLLIAQDTGAAIKGAARGDIFFGSGEAAGEMAGRVRHPADFYVLLPR